MYYFLIFNILFHLHRLHHEIFLININTIKIYQALIILIIMSPDTTNKNTLSIIYECNTLSNFFILLLYFNFQNYFLRNHFFNCSLQFILSIFFYFFQLNFF